VAGDVEAKRSKIHGRRDALEVPPHEKRFVGREVLAKVVEGRFQLWWSVREQNQFCLFGESSEASRTRESFHYRIDSIAGEGQCRRTGRTHELQKSPAVHDIHF
jgi:hypothetical protein